MKFWKFQSGATRPLRKFIIISVNQTLVVGMYNTQYEHKKCQLQHITSSYMDENTLQWPLLRSHIVMFYWVNVFDLKSCQHKGLFTIFFAYYGKKNLYF